MNRYFPTPTELDEQLGKLPALRRNDLKERYFGFDAGPCFDFIAKHPRNAATVNWMGQMLELWEIRRSLAMASAYDVWFGGLPEAGMAPDKILEGEHNPNWEEDLAKWDTAAAGCTYYLRNALFRFYALNEKFLQFCNSCVQLSVPENEVRASVIKEKLSATKPGNASAEYLLKELDGLCKTPEYQEIVEARKGITHRQDPFHLRFVHSTGWGDVEHPSCGCPTMLGLARALLQNMTQLLDRLLEFISSLDNFLVKA